jgi:hypothetical protein
MGGNLKFNGENLVCASHGWTYNLDGTNIDELSPTLKNVKIISESDSKIEILLPVKDSSYQKRELTSSLKVSLHSHATVEIIYRDKSILFDPWLEGPAFYGSWHLYPKPQIRAREIETEAIIITHPHPDHFHIPTLKRIDKNIPIYFPSFLSKTIENSLDKLGFTNINTILWNDPVKIADFFSIKFLRPRSMWEDSAVLTQVIDEGTVFSWLNLVDAGSVIDEFTLPEIDLLSSAFDQGASGYPLTWTNLSDNRKVRILNSQKTNTVTLLSSRTKKVGAKYFLPFAGHWRLGLSQHQKYAEMIPHTKFEELNISFKENAPHAKFLGLYPGESFDFYAKTHEINSTARNEILNGFIPSLCLSRTSSNDNFAEDFNAQMEILQKKGEAFGVENVNFIISSSDGYYEKNFRFISSESKNRPIMKISVKVPDHILKLFSKGEANWDHIAIGYWGEWSREPDSYPANFMRLLQSGVDQLIYSKSIDLPLDLSSLLQTTISEIIEKNSDQVIKILSRLGLPCVSCIRTNSEKLGSALEIHNVDIRSNLWLLREILGIKSSGNTH